MDKWLIDTFTVLDYVKLSDYEVASMSLLISILIYNVVNSIFGRG